MKNDAAWWYGLFCHTVLVVGIVGSLTFYLLLIAFLAGY